MPYAEGRLPTTTRMFLVAGGSDIANFAQEVVQQRQLWRAAGIGDAQLACYWARPTDEAWQSDRDQYRALRDDVADCRRAEPATLRHDLLAVAKQKPSSVYIFVSSHGLPPILRWNQRTRDRRKVAAHFELSVSDVQTLDQHSVGLEAGPGPGLSDTRQIVDGYRAGQPVGDLMMSPSTLAETLSVYPASTLKVVVLQACFSGGFIGDTAPDGELSALTQVPNIVILAATAHDRPSFGCGAGAKTTYYGGAINKSLLRHVEDGAQLPDIPWRAVSDDAAFAVDVMESVDGERPSIPSFFSNVDGVVTVR